MISSASEPLQTEWLTLREVADALHETPGRVRRMLDDRQLVGVRRGGAVMVPSAFIVNGRPLGSLRGTLFVLHDAGFTDAEAVDWLFTVEDSIGVAPLRALLDGRKSEVRRVAQTLG